jgi:uncharacterized protein YndB with AHSA1/START domain
MWIVSGPTWKTPVGGDGMEARRAALTGAHSAYGSGVITLEQTYAAAPEEIWRLWTTAEGIEAWWPPEGFTAEVHELDLRPWGELVYTFTATAEPQIEFMRSAGMPLATTARKRFTIVDPPHTIAYDSLIDFIPGMDSYWQSTTVELEREGDKTHVTMLMDPLHDEEWTQRLVAGRTNELENLERVLRR